VFAIKTFISIRQLISVCTLILPNVMKVKTGIQLLFNVFQKCITVIAEAVVVQEVVGAEVEELELEVDQVVRGVGLRDQEVIPIEERRIQA
jgi:hypothetical protein